MGALVEPQVEPRLGQCPVAFDRPGGDAEYLRRLVDAQAAEEEAFDDAGLAWIKHHQPLQGLVYVDQVGGERGIF